MADQKTVEDLVNYYTNLLIIQYHDKPKAQATIQLLGETMLANGVLLDVQNGYDVDTAVGVQLDVIGKYVGVDRFFSEIDLTNFFGLVLDSQIGSLPTSPPVWGFGTQATFDNYDYNGIVVYNDLITSENALSDDNFRILIKLRILQNNSNYSDAQINTEMWDTFGALIRPESTGNMAMQYFIEGQITTLIQAILIKKLLPKPMGVLLQIITGITGDMFSFANYAGVESPYGYGLSNFANYATLPGEILTYSQIAVG